MCDIIISSKIVYANSLNIFTLILRQRYFLFIQKIPEEDKEGNDYCCYKDNLLHVWLLNGIYIMGKEYDRRKEGHQNRIGIIR